MGTVRGSFKLEVKGSPGLPTRKFLEKQDKKALQMCHSIGVAEHSVKPDSIQWLLQTLKL